MSHKTSVSHSFPHLFFFCFFSISTFGVLYTPFLFESASYTNKFTTTDPLGHLLYFKGNFPAFFPKIFSTVSCCLNVKHREYVLRYISLCERRNIPGYRNMYVKNQGCLYIHVQMFGFVFYIHASQIHVTENKI